MPTSLKLIHHWMMELYVLFRWPPTTFCTILTVYTQKKVLAKMQDLYFNYIETFYPCELQRFNIH